MPNYLPESLVDQFWDKMEVVFDYTPHIFIVFLSIAIWHIYSRVKKHKSDVWTAIISIVYIAVLGIIGFFAFVSISFRYHNIGW